MKKLHNDNHCFKWKDEALMDEIETLHARIGRLEKMVKEMSNVNSEMEKVMIENVQIKIEKDILERVEYEMVQAKCDVKKMIILQLIGCLFLVGLIQFF
ncbi:unnamed protein product [Cochlearia groenlandica]